MAGNPTPAALAVRDAAGPFVRTAQRVVRRLLAGPGTLPELVADTGAPRREVEQLLAALAADVVRHGDTYQLPASLRAEYEAVLDLAALDAHPLDDVVGRQLAARGDLVEFLAGLDAARPRPQRDLDHVAATPETVARRALWLDSVLDLTRTEVLCVGDHDLTSLGVLACAPGARVTVVDLDDRVLRFVDEVARRRGWSARCVWGDFRLGLPVSVRGTAGVAVTDPPYTPEGVSTFAVAALQGLADPERGRVVVAYGHGDHQPALGLKVQQALQELHLVFEAILPGFNRYSGAQAIGSRSDLYVCRPTARTWRALPAVAARQDPRIYTHGNQSLESRPAGDRAALEDLLGRVTAAGGRSLLVGDAWPAVPAGTARASVASLLAKGLPPQLGGGRDVRALVDLTTAPPSWLVRVLLALGAARVDAVAPVGTCTAADADLLRDRCTLRAEPLPGGRLEHVTATPADGGAPVAAAVLAKAHGRLGNVWREALISAARGRGEALTKNEARALVEGACAQAGLPDLVDVRLVEAPRHLLEAAVALARDPGSRGDLRGCGDLRG